MLECDYMFSGKINQYETILCYKAVLVKKTFNYYEQIWINIIIVRHNSLKKNIFLVII